MAAPAFAPEENSVDRIHLVLDSLVRERQALRDRGTDRAALDANRIAIVYWQQKLSERLIQNGVR